MAINWPPTRREASVTGESQKSISTKNGNTRHRRETAWEWGGSYYSVWKSWDLSRDLSHHDSSCDNIDSSVCSLTDFIDCWCNISTEEIFQFTRRLLHSGTQIFPTSRMTITLMIRRMKETSWQETRTLPSSRPRPEARSRWGESGSFDLALDVGHRLSKYFRLNLY